MTIEKKQFKATIYQFLGASLIGHSDEMVLERNNIENVIAFHPLRKVDPLGLFAYVTDGYNTYSVRKKALGKIETVTIEWERPRYSTHNQEMQLMLRAMNEYFLKHYSVNS